MKDLKDLFEAELDLDEKGVSGSYQVGQSIRFRQADVQKSNPNVKVVDDSGMITAKSGTTYKVKIEANQEIVTVREDQIDSYGDANDHGNDPAVAQDTGGPAADGQV